jgi:hypothetical protein
VTALALVAVLSACTAGGGAPDSGPDALATAPGNTAPSIDIVGDEIRLAGADGSSRTLAVLDPTEDGELVHASLRPGEHGTMTVLALTRTSTDAGARYELRYLVADDEAATDLYWFPWRLQVVDDLTAVHDTPPLPVWSPTGDVVAWVEWDGEGTRLRTVGWRDEGASSNPSDDASAYRLDGVPPGTQLEAWEVGSDGVPVLRGVGGETVWRIRLDVGRWAIAMAEPRS